MRWLLVVVATFLVLIGLIWIFQRRLIYLPTQAVPDPDSVHLDVEEVSFPTDDGLTLTAWFVPSVRPQPTGTVLVLNGNAGNRAHRTPLAAALSQRGYSVLLVDYRGYGGNPGSPSESALNADARAATAYLETRSDVDADRLVYFGESLGAAVAIDLATARPPAAVVLRSPFTSLPDIAAVHYPFLPASILLWDRYPNLTKATDIDMPVLVIGGSDDTIVPIEQSRELFEAIPAALKRIVVIDGAGHNDAALLYGEEMIRELAEFLDMVLASRSG